MRHRNETCGWHVCIGRVTHVVDLDPTVTHTGPHNGGAGRAADPPGAPEAEEHPPRRNHDKTQFLCRSAASKR